MNECGALSSLLVPILIVMILSGIEQERLAWLESLKSMTSSRLPKIDLIQVRSVAKKTEPVIVSNGHVEFHLQVNLKHLAPLIHFDLNKRLLTLFHCRITNITPDPQDDPQDAAKRSEPAIRSRSGAYVC